MQRITQVSKANLMVADRAQLVESAPGLYCVKVFRGDQSAYLASSGPGVLLIWPTVSGAMRVIRRFRPDLVVTTI